jgi:hypothetical protein
MRCNVGSIGVWDKPLQGLRVNPSRVSGGTGGARDGAEPHMFGSIGMYWDFGFSMELNKCLWTY